MDSMSDTNYPQAAYFSGKLKKWMEDQTLEQIRRAHASRLPAEAAPLGDPHNGPFLLATMRGYLVGLSGRQNVPNPYHETDFSPGGATSLDREYLQTCWEKGIIQGREHRAKELESRDPPSTLTINQIAAALVRIGHDVPI